MMNRTKKYLSDLLILTFVMVLIPLIFKFIEERQVAAAIAGTLFVFSSGFILIRHWVKLRFENPWWIGFMTQFLILFALPIWVMRIIFWGEPFSELSFFGVPGPVYHQISTISFLMAWVATAGAVIYEIKTKKGASDEAPS